jgi:flagellar biosynthesis/type III secretory pathway chaperone
MSLATTAADAEQALDDLAALLEQLTGVVEQETLLVRAGQIRTACTLEPTKTKLAGQLLAAGERLKQNAKFFMQSAPARCAALARVQDTLRVVLQRNMMVLATAHAVSEGIMRRLSGDLARKASPQVYGSSGRTAAPNPKHGKPLALSRTL